MHLRILQTILPALLLATMPLLGLRAQVQGIVKDAETGDTLAFAYILIPATQKGCFSGLNGQFSLPLTKPDSIRISLLGYQPQKVLANPGSPLTILLQPGALALDDVLITPTENPALRIIRNAVEARQANDPANFAPYSFDSYNKLVGAPIYGTAVPDSDRLDIHLFLSETATHRYQARPGQVKETIRSARLAGYPGKVIPLTASDLQDMSLYGNYLSVLEQRYLSPISPPGLHQYRFLLRDTLVVGPDSIFSIDIRPANRNFDALEGTMRIHSNRWALITADFTLITQENSLLVNSGEIRQVCTQLPDGHWVPAELFTEIDLRPLSKTDPFRLHFSGYSQLSHHQFPDSSRPRGGLEESLVVAEGAGKEDSLLRSSRIKPLSPVDSLTYHRLDSLGKVFGLSRIFDLSWKLGQERLGLGPVDLMLDKLFLQNRVEKFRLGLGLLTNDKVSRRFSLGVWAGYGTLDKELKYGGTFKLTPFGDDRLYGGLSYAEDLVETGWRRLGLRTERPISMDIYREYGIRRWYLTDMDYVTTQEAFVGGRLPSDLGIRLARRWESVRPAYDYSFSDSTQFRFDEWEALFRWAPGARYIRQGDQRVLKSLQGPVFSLRLTQGLDGQHGDYAYRAAALGLLHRFPAFRGGQVTYAIFAGAADRSLPRARIRNFRGSYAQRNFTDVPLAFNTMRFDEFAADNFAEAFLYLRPKLRWLHIGPHFRPQLTFSMAAAWGQLYNDGLSHGPSILQAPSSVYLEPGLAITRLFPMRKEDTILSSYLAAFGLGIYYRVGAYTLPTFKENIALRISLALW